MWHKILPTGNWIIWIYLVSHVKLTFFSPIPFQHDMMMSVSSSKPTVNEDDLNKLKKFTDDFGQEGWYHTNTCDTKDFYIIAETYTQWTVSLWLVSISCIPQHTYRFVFCCSQFQLWIFFLQRVSMRMVVLCVTATISWYISSWNSNIMKSACASSQYGSRQGSALHLLPIVL